MALAILKFLIRILNWVPIKSYFTYTEYNLYADPFKRRAVAQPRPEIFSAFPPAANPSLVAVRVWFIRAKVAGMALYAVVIAF